MVPVTISFVRWFLILSYEIIMMSIAKELLRAFVIFNLLVIFARSEYGSALVDLEPLLITKEKIVETIDHYINLEVQRLDKIKRLAQDYDNLYKTASEDIDNFLSNPINSYLLVKRLTTDWKFVMHLVEGYASKVPIYQLVKDEIFPNDYDLEEVANSVIRLQETYLLNTTDLVKGKVAGFKGDTELTASDCFELGMNAYNETDYNLALLWFQQSLDRLDTDEFQMVYKPKLLEYLSFSAFKVNDMELALKLTKDLIKIDPRYPGVNNNFYFYKKEVLRKRKESPDPKSKEVTEAIVDESEDGRIDPNLIDVKRYKQLCRGEQLRTPEQERKLKCRYTSNGSKYLLLHPVKEETLNLDPLIVVYHDVIRDNDIEFLKDMAEDIGLERATVLNASTGILEYAKYRTSKSCWLQDNKHPRIKHISMMIEEISGLEMDTAEDLQMNKYGLGGHYLGHYDFKREGEFDPFAKFGTGNRMATWMFYLSDVKAGGSTVFPDIDVEIKPRKGSAALWLNLFKSGEGDLRTKHAACPVIAGKKWVANKWIHERGQEFRRPCDLNPLA
ncbi:hypothetical protein JTE90_022378 [Oedothorax gibbosus]|uniref:procollagen-proline 4-dioxygenase n=1 Tax=Oedothorax gibbosus TaxID=931172 RepID=A0AAV6UMU6_9ARAC|nr:hypothetical protein JTE90_022378 [Oedothorax gibbosus]